MPPCREDGNKDIPSSMIILRVLIFADFTSCKAKFPQEKNAKIKHRKNLPPSVQLKKKRALYTYVTGAIYIGRKQEH